VYTKPPSVLAGVKADASWLLFPAAAITGMSAALSLAMAAVIVDTGEDLPPKDIETTARLAPGGSAPVSAALYAASWVTTQSIPAIIHDQVPTPVMQVSTCTGTTVAFFATPYRLPAAEEAQCVP
jgi:hypothetical protein